MGSWLGSLIGVINVIDTRPEDADLRGGVGWSSITAGGAQSEGPALVRRQMVSWAARASTVIVRSQLA
jgi:hypothetical protein